MATKETITAKQIGKNLIVVIDGKKHTKVCNKKEEIEPIKNKILLFNKRNSATLKKEILLLVDKTIVEKETKTAKAKGVKKSLKTEKKKATKTTVKKAKVEKDLIQGLVEKSESEGLDAEEVTKLEELIRKNKKVIAKEEKAPEAPPERRRTGEY